MNVRITNHDSQKLGGLVGKGGEEKNCVWRDKQAKCDISHQQNIRNKTKHQGDFIDESQNHYTELNSDTKFYKR